MTQTSLTHLQRREIQAPLAACLLQGFASVLGHDQAIAIATIAIQEDAHMAGRYMAQHYGNNSLVELLRIVREVWAEAGSLEFELLEQTDERLSFDVHRCRYAEMYTRLGTKEFGYCLSCNRDEAFAMGFNPRLRLQRTRTIMQGAERCDFRFILE